MRGTEHDDLRIKGVLSDVEFPGRSWELIAHAEHRGSDWKSLAELRSLPPGDYPDLNAVIVALRKSRRVEAARKVDAARKVSAARKVEAARNVSATGRSGRHLHTVHPGEQLAPRPVGP
jgi:hypothetical protein